MFVYLHLGPHLTKTVSQQLHSTGQASKILIHPSGPVNPTPPPLCPLSTPLFNLAVRRVPPRFSIPPTSHEVMPGGSVNLTCVAVGAPMPYVKWMSGKVELTQEEQMPIGRNVLELTNIRKSANYTCVAVSSLGMIETIAKITVKGQKHSVKVGDFLKCIQFIEL